MKFKQTVRFGLAALLAVSALAVSAPHSLAQPPGGGGGFQMTPEMKAKMEAWQKYRDNHKNLTQLQTLVMQIRGMEKEDPSLQLNKAQSIKMLAILKDWGPKKELSEDQAKDITKKINGFLSDKQIKKMTTIRTGFGGGGRPGGPGGAPPSGGGRPGGGAPGGPGGFKMPDPPKGSFNPLNPDTLPFEQMRPQAKKSMQEFTASLQKRAQS